MNDNASDRMLRVAEVCDMTGLARATIYRLEAAGLFPSRRRLGVSRVAWLRSDVEAWLTSRPPIRTQTGTGDSRA